MVAFDYSKEPNNPWNVADWNPKAQIDFMRRMRTEHRYDGTGEPRITQRIAQSDTKGIPPKIIRPQAPLVIVQKRFLGSQVPPEAPLPPVVGFGQIGIMEATQRFSLAIAPFSMILPGVIPSEAHCDGAPTSDAVMLLLNPLGATMCTITFPAGSQTGTIAWLVTTTVNAGDVLSVVGPGPADPTLMGVNIAFIGVRP